MNPDDFERCMRECAEAFAEGRILERNRIVAWLRYRADSLEQRVPDFPSIRTLRHVAELIEAGASADVA